MKPFYEDSLATIYCADNRGLVNEIGMVDLILTDPPYGIGEAAGKNKSRGNMAIAKDFGNDTWDNSPVEYDLLQKWVNKGRKAIVFGGNYYPFPPTSCWLIWDKENGATDFADCEMAWTNLEMATRLFRFRWAGMLQGDMKHKEFRYHPTQKPIPVMRWCITKANILVESICDPFMGGGTTLVAAKSMGIKSVGIDFKEKYCEIAANRLSQQVMEFDVPKQNIEKNLELPL